MCECMHEYIDMHMAGELSLEHLTLLSSVCGLLFFVFVPLKINFTLKTEFSLKR